MRGSASNELSPLACPMLCTTSTVSKTVANMDKIRDRWRSRSKKYSSQSQQPQTSSAVPAAGSSQVLGNVPPKAGILAVAPTDAVPENLAPEHSAPEHSAPDVEETIPRPEPHSLWSRAYQVLKERDPELVDEYEKLLSFELDSDGKHSSLNLRYYLIVSHS